MPKHKEILGAILFLLIGLSACRQLPPTDHELKLSEFKEAPVTEWRDYTGSKRSDLEAVLEQLKPTEGVTPDQASEWTAGLLAALPAHDNWTLSLGVAPSQTVVEAGFVPFLVLPAEPTLLLTQTCLLTSGCASCDNAMVVAGGEAPPPPKKEFKRVCGTLSTAYSLVYVLGKRSQFDQDGQIGTVTVRQEMEGTERVNKKYWKKGFLQTIREDQEHDPESGTPRDKIKKAYERYGCQCGDEVSIADAGGIDAWRDQLKAQLEGDDPADCHFIIEGPDWAHDMHIDGVDEDGNLGVADTGVQGSGNGDDIPVVAGQQEWELGGTAANPTITCKSSPTGEASVRYWSGKNITMASYLCCTCP